MNLRVRTAVVDDLPSVIALERSVAEAPHWTTPDYAEIVTGSGVRRCLFVAETADELAGFAVGKAVAGIGELESVAVRPGSRRAGVGKALCMAVVAWCRKQGASAVELEVRAASVGAMALYESLGFERVGVRRRYYREPEDDAVLMRLRMSGS